MNFTHYAEAIGVSPVCLRSNMKKYPDKSIDEIIRITRERAYKTYKYDDQVFLTFSSLCKYVQCHPVSLRNAIKKHPELSLAGVIALVQSRRKRRS